MTYHLGLDIGTTATKACAFSPAGEMLGFAERDYELLHPAPGAAVQEPRAVLRAAEAALAELVQTMGRKPAGVGLSCPMHSLLLLDADCKPISQLYTWADTRSQAVLHRFSDQERKSLHRLTGTPVHPMSPLVKICWLAEAHPAKLKGAAFCSDLKSWLVSQWTTNGLLLDEQLASATGMMNLQTSEWAEEALAKTGLAQASLPQIRPANTLLEWQPELAAKLGLQEVPLFLGGSDGVLANLGSGILEPGAVALSIGTSGAVRTTHARAEVDPKHGLFNYKMDAGHYVIGGPTNNGAKVLEYWQNLLAAHFSDVGAFIDGAMSVVPEDCPTFEPWLYGERAPLWNAAATAALKGLRGHHGPAHIARAVLEGVTGNIVNILRQLEVVVGPANRILASGGFTKSPEWVALLAERSGREVVIAEAAQASAYGAALVAMNVRTDPEASRSDL